MPYKTALLFCLIGLSFPSHAQQVNLRAVVSDSNPAPFAIWDARAQMTGGLIPQLLNRVAAELGLPIDYQNIPRARIEAWLRSGQADIACFLNPAWVEQPKAYDWSVPLFQSQQLIIRNVSASPIRQEQDLYGKRVGTTRGFVYPELAQAFAQHQILRDDALTLESNLQRLKQGRLDAVLTVDLSYAHVLQKHPIWRSDFVAEPLWAEPATLFCAISQQSAERQRLLRQLSRLQAEGHLKLMLQPYQITTQ